jgi:hypothetical protein
MSARISDAVMAEPNKVIDALPVITGRLHHHPLNTPLPQPDRHLQQRRGGGGIAPDLLHPPPRLTRVRHPHARLQRGLTQIQRRHPLHHQLNLVDLFHPRCPSTQPNTMTAARRSQRKNGSSRTLVLMATMRSSANDSQDQTISRAHLRQEHSTSASDRTRFSRIHGVPTGATQLFRDRCCRPSSRTYATAP